MILLQFRGSQTQCNLIFDSHFVSIKLILLMVKHMIDKYEVLFEKLF